MRSVVIFYHKNILNIYERTWIDKCIDSIANQTYQNFDIIELNYGPVDNNSDEFVFIPGKDKKFIQVPFDNHIDAMNFLLNDLFLNQKYDTVFNTNMDDYYDITRFEKQINVILMGYDLVSSDFCYIQDNNGIDEITLHLNICQYGDIATNILKKHNVIAHPCVAFTKTFWDGTFEYNNLLGWEDLELWMRTIRTKKFNIIDEELLYYRLHNNQVTKNYKN